MPAEIIARLEQSPQTAALMSAVGIALKLPRPMGRGLCALTCYIAENLARPGAKLMKGAHDRRRRIWPTAHRKWRNKCEKLLSFRTESVLNGGV